MDILHSNRGLLNPEATRPGGAGFDVDEAFMAALNELKGAGSTSTKAKRRSSQGGESDSARAPDHKPISKENLEELSRSEPGVLPVGDTRSAEEIIAATPALANLREVHKQLLRRMIPGYEKHPAAAFHAAAVIRHIKNYDGNGNWVSDRAKAENSEIHGFKSAESIHTHKDTEARRFENFIRGGYATLKGEEKIAPFMPFSETRSAEEIIADSPLLSSLAPGKTQDMLDEIIPGYRTDARAAWHADRVMRMLERYDSNGGSFSGGDEHSTRRLEQFLATRYDAINDNDGHSGLDIDQGEFDASTERREDLRSRLTQEAETAAENFDKERYDALVAAGADGEAVPYREPREALGDAVRSGDIDEVQRLLDSGKVDVNAVDGEGRTVLFDLMGMRISSVDRDTPSRMLNVLLDKGADATRLDKNGVAVLEALRDAAIIRVPYRIGDPTQTRSAELTKAADQLRRQLTTDLRAVIGNEDTKQARALIAAGADGHAGIQGTTSPKRDVSILHVAIALERRDVVDAILTSTPKKALAERLNQPWSEGSTALHVAQASGQQELADELRRLGADDTLRNDAGKTPDEAHAHLQKRGLPAAVVGAANLLEYLGLAGPAGWAIAAGIGLGMAAYWLYTHHPEGNAGDTSRPLPSPREGDPFTTLPPSPTHPTTELTWPAPTTPPGPAGGPDAMPPPRFMPDSPEAYHRIQYALQVPEGDRQATIERLLFDRDSHAALLALDFLSDTPEFGALLWDPTPARDAFTLQLAGFNQAQRFWTDHFPTDPAAFDFGIPFQTLADNYRYLSPDRRQQLLDTALQLPPDQARIDRVRTVLTPQWDLLNEQQRQQLNGFFGISNPVNRPPPPPSPPPPPPPLTPSMGEDLPSLPPVGAIEAMDDVDENETVNRLVQQVLNAPEGEQERALTRVLEASDPYAAVHALTLLAANHGFADLLINNPSPLQDSYDRLWRDHHYMQQYWAATVPEDPADLDFDRLVPQLAEYVPYLSPEQREHLVRAATWLPQNTYAHQDRIDIVIGVLTPQRHLLSEADHDRITAFIQHTLVRPVFGIEETGLLQALLNLPGELQLSVIADLLAMPDREAALTGLNTLADASRHFANILGSDLNPDRFSENIEGYRAVLSPEQFSFNALRSIQGLMQGRTPESLHLYEYGLVLQLHDQFDPEEYNRILAAADRPDDENAVSRYDEDVYEDVITAVLDRIDDASEEEIAFAFNRLRDMTAMISSLEDGVGHTSRVAHMTRMIAGLIASVAAAGHRFGLDRLDTLQNIADFRLQRSEYRGLLDLLTDEINAARSKILDNNAAG